MNYSPVGEQENRLQGFESVSFVEFVGKQGKVREPYVVILQDLVRIFNPD